MIQVKVKQETMKVSYVLRVLIFKGTIHPKMKNLSEFTHPHVFGNPDDILSSLEHRRHYL